MSKYSGEHTILETLDQVVLDEVRKKQKNACKVAETKKTKQLQTAQLFKSKKIDMQGMTVYLGSVSTKRAQCRCWIRQNGMREAAASAAAVFVDDNPAAPGSRCSQLAAGLLGGMLVTPEWFLSCGQNGLGLCVKSAAAIDRKLWVSDKFVSSHRCVMKILRAALAQPTSKWRLSTRDKFLDFIMRPSSKQRKWTFIALTTPKEKAVINVDTCLDLTGFMEFVFRPEAAASTMVF